MPSLSTIYQVKRKRQLPTTYYPYIVEGLAVGVGFGAIGKSPMASFENARYTPVLFIAIHCVYIYRNLAIGIALQNFPEGLAVSLPLNAAGVGSMKSFWSADSV